MHASFSVFFLRSRYIVYSFDSVAAATYVARSSFRKGPAGSSSNTENQILVSRGMSDGILGAAHGAEGIACDPFGAVFRAPYFRGVPGSSLWNALRGLVGLSMVWMFFDNCEIRYGFVLYLRLDYLMRRWGSRWIMARCTGEVV